MRAVGDSGLLAEPAVVFARNRLVVVLPRKNPAGIGRLQDLARAGVKVVIAAEAVPVGRYTRAALERLAKSPGFRADYAAGVQANVVSYEDNVKGVVAKVQLGEADAGVVYRSDASGSAASDLATLDIPDAVNVIAVYPIARLTSSTAPELARDFVDLVLSMDGQRTLIRSGLMPGDSAAPSGRGP
jgi:molybdate transport system substrate-binding protein